MTNLTKKFPSLRTRIEYAMKKFSFKILIICLLSFSIQAQEQLQNPGFETWEGSGATLEPLDWSSLKTSDNSFLASSAPQVLFQDAGRNGGFSVKLENKSALGIVANGILTNGRVHADLNPANGYVFTDAADQKWNTPFTSRPDSIVGWFKYQPASAGGTTDKGKVEVLLHKTGNGQNPVGNTAENMVGKARFDMTVSSSSWQRFSAPFNYTSQDSPDYILVVLTSGDSTSAINGSIAWFDDLELIYNATSLTQEKVESFHVFQKMGALHLKNLPEGSQYAVINALGQTIVHGTSNSSSANVPLQETGIYFVRISSKSGILTRKIAFIKE
jgi:hypothetical protein